MAKAKSILIFRIGSLGDTLVSVPAFHLVRRDYPTHNIVLLTNTPVDGGIKAASSYQILLGSGLVDDYIEYPHKLFSISELFKLRQKIIDINPELVIYLMPVRKFSQRIRDFLFFIFSGCFSVKGFFPGLNVNTHLLQSDGINYESEAKRLIRSIGYKNHELTASLFSLNISDSEKNIAKDLIVNIKKPIIAISIGAKIPAKNWGKDRWIELIKQLYQEGFSNYSMACFGSADEFDVCEEILSYWHGDGLNLCGKISPRMSAATLENASIYIGHDSGPMHLASSVGIPTISIFAARNKPGIWFPFGNEKNVFYKNLPCSNCGLDECLVKEMACIRSIMPIDVTNKIKELLPINPIL